MMVLKTIEEHEKEVLRIYKTPLTGIECPNCKEELQFEGRGILLSSPGQREVVCINCDYKRNVYVL